MGQTTYAGKATIPLQYKSSFATLSPVGAHLLSFIAKGTEILHFNPENEKRCGHPCGPNFGALSLYSHKDNIYIFGGKKYQLDQHGFLRALEWQVPNNFDPKAENASIKLLLESTSDNRHPKISQEKQYPFDFRYEMETIVSENQVENTFSYTNFTVGQDAVTELAFHNYFFWMPGMWMQGLDKCLCDDRTNPGQLQRWKRPLKPFNELIPRDLHFRIPDSKTIKLCYPNGIIVTILLSPNVEQFVVWTDPSQGEFLCAEPVAKGLNSLNSGDAFKVKFGNTVEIRQRIIVETA